MYILKKKKEEEDDEEEEGESCTNVYKFIHSCISKTINIIINMSLELQFRACQG